MAERGANHTAQTAENYLYEIKKYLAINPRARYFKYADIVCYIERLGNKYHKVANRARMLAAVKKYYDYLLFTGRRKDHPCRRFFIKRKRTAIQTQDLFDMEELELLYNRPNRYNKLNIRNQVIISLLIHQALTSNEIVNLVVSNINLDKGTVYVKASRNIAGRKLQLDVSQINLLNRYINETRLKMKCNDTNKLILSIRGKEISVDGINSIFEPLKLMFPGKTLNPCKIRMSVVSYWLNEKKIPVEQVMDLSGHKWASSVLMYKKTNIDEQLELINRYHPLR